MFGTFRFALALMVVWYHLIDREFAGPIAVYGFYCLSGYLMTAVINDVYSDGVAGFGRYLANRALRTFPTYWAALVLSALAVAVVPASALQVSSNFTWPSAPLSDLFIVGHEPLSPSLSPIAWSLSVEIVFYVAMGVALARWRIVTQLWLVFSTVIVTTAIAQGFPFSWFQFSLPAASLPFACGSAIYHYRHQLPQIPLNVAACIATAAVATAVLMSAEIGLRGGLYFALVIIAAAVAGLCGVARRRWDSALGDLAYPVFLLHYPCAAAVIALTGSEAWPSDVAAISTTLVASCSMVAAVERPLLALRSQLRRPRASPSVAE
jgi:peptidoglycan/LPS O-acetylase OafA/YrhL